MIFSHSKTANAALLLLLLTATTAVTITNAFVANQNHHHHHHPQQQQQKTTTPKSRPTSSHPFVGYKALDITSTTTTTSNPTTTTALNVWWFGGTEQDGGVNTSGGEDGDSCELVAVRIERTSPNSRRIAGDIIVPVSIDEVWQILTDYDRLSVHVPNLVESKVVRTLPPAPAASGTAGRGGGRLASVVQGAAGNDTGRSGSAAPGDGTYRCRLYQKGAQKIIGFDFSASVTMDMTEKIVVPPPPPVAETTESSSEDQQRQQQQQQRLKNLRSMPQERKINFKCVDSQFFTEFDGDWTVKEQLNVATGQTETLCSYVVDVRPKGPVPVAALEWRIREDVPSNLRAVKAAALLLSAQNSATPSAVVADSAAGASNIVTIDSARQAMGRAVRRAAANVPTRNGVAQNRRLATVPILNDWEKDETMAKYL